MKTINPPREAAQLCDFLEAALHAGKPVSLDLLLSLEQPLPLPPDDYQDWSGNGERTAAERRADARLEFLNPGLLRTVGECEVAKYRAPWPDDDAPYRASPLAKHLGRFILHIRGKWSRDVWSKREKALSFKEYIAQYVGDRLGIGGCYRSDDPPAQLLRLATGQPRFLPTKTGVRK